MTSPLVPRTEALQKQTHHQFVPGLGYLAHTEPPELPPGAKGSANCNPPAEASDGSLHLFQPPGGHPQMVMIWVAAEAAWASSKPGAGNRLAWSAAHLSKAGWEYIGPLEQPAALAAPKKKQQR